MNRAASSLDAAVVAARRPHGTGGRGLIVILFVLLALCCCDCGAKQPSRSLHDVVNKDNVTLSAGNICLESSVQEETLVWYNLDTSDCFEDPSLGFKYLEVEARLFRQCSETQQWFVVLNTEDQKLSTDNAKFPTDENFVDLVGADEFRLYGHLDVPLGEASQPWAVGIYSSCGPLQFTLKSWCSVFKGCNLSCGDPDSGPCVSLQKCRCSRNEDQNCTIDIDELPGVDDTVSEYGFSHNEDTLKYGEWKYFRFETFNNASRTLVQMERAYGDLVLFVKPDDEADADYLCDSVPKEQDAMKYADLLSFQNRLSHHSVFVNGSGKFYIGVYSADSCLKTDSIFNLTVTTASANDPFNLCPLNCSYPQGHCVADNLCSCEAGYGGQYCAGSLYPGSVVKSYIGELPPGGWTYINMSYDPTSEDVDVSISFMSSSGHPILLAQDYHFPTLTDFTLKFSNSTLGATPSDTYRINGSSVILGVFNVDYMDRGVSHFEIALIRTRKELAIWITILVAFGSSMLLLLAILTVRRFILRRGQTGDAASGAMDFEATPQDLEMVQSCARATEIISTLPLLAYQKDMLPKEDAGCSICLNNYDIAEIVCRLPRCGHIFHIRCLEQWFRRDGSCPLCRLALDEQRGEASHNPFTLQLQPSASDEFLGRRFLAEQYPTST